MSPDQTRPTGDELVLPAIAALATLLVVPVLVVAGDFAFWMLLAAVAAAAMVATRHDSPHALAALGVIALLWIAARPDALSPWSIVVALLMFTIHVSLALQTTAPPRTSLGREVILRWVGRSSVVVVLTVLVYVVAAALRNLHRSDAEAVLAMALVLLGGLILVLRRETLDGGRPGSRSANP